MRMHQSLIERILKSIDMHGGRSDDTKLMQALYGIEISEYTQQNGTKVLVETARMNKEVAEADALGKEYHAPVRRK